MSRWFGNSSTHATVVDAQFVEYVDDDAVQKSACNQPASAIERRIAEQVAKITETITSALEMTIDSVISNFEIPEIVYGKIWVILYSNSKDYPPTNIKHIDVGRLIRCARKHGCTFEYVPGKKPDISPCNSYQTTEFPKPIETYIGYDTLAVIYKNGKSDNRTVKDGRHVLCFDVQTNHILLYLV